MTPEQILIEALELIASTPSLPNPERDADWKNCMKNSAYTARAAIAQYNKSKSEPVSPAWPSEEEIQDAADKAAPEIALEANLHIGRPEMSNDELGFEHGFCCGVAWLKERMTGKK